MMPDEKKTSQTEEVIGASFGKNDAIFGWALGKYLNANEPMLIPKGFL